MINRIIFIGLLFLNFYLMFGQNANHGKSVGFSYGFGNEIKNTNYSYTNSYYKFQLGYVLKETKNFQYELLLQPEINFATHQLLNLYFVTPEDSDYIEKRERFTKFKKLNEYAIGVGLRIRKSWSKSFGTYFLASVGPMIIDTETERLSKGFAFSDVLALGVTVKIDKIVLNENYLRTFRNKKKIESQNSYSLKYKYTYSFVLKQNLKV